MAAQVCNLFAKLRIQVELERHVYRPHERSVTLNGRQSAHWGFGFRFVGGIVSVKKLPTLLLLNTKTFICALRSFVMQMGLLCGRLNTFVTS